MFQVFFPQGYNEGRPNPFDKPIRLERGRRKQVSAGSGTAGRGKRSASADDALGPILGTSLDAAVMPRLVQPPTIKAPRKGVGSGQGSEGSGESSGGGSGGSGGSSSARARPVTQGSLKRGERSASVNGESPFARSSSGSRSSFCHRVSGPKGAGDDGEAAALAVLQTAAGAEERAAEASTSAEAAAPAAAFASAEAAASTESALAKEKKGVDHEAIPYR